MTEKEKTKQENREKRKLENKEDKKINLENKNKILEQLTKIMATQEANRKHFEKGISTIKYALESIERTSKEHVELVKMLVNNNYEHIQSLENKIDGIILSEGIADRSGRKPLTDDEIEQIRELLKQGHPQRKVAEMVDRSNGTVAKYGKGIVAEKKVEAVTPSARPSATDAEKNLGKPVDIMANIKREKERRKAEEEEARNNLNKTLNEFKPLTVEELRGKSGGNG